MLTIAVYVIKDKRYIRVVLHSKGTVYSFIIILISRLFFIYCFIRFIYFIAYSIIVGRLDNTVLGEYILFIIYIFYFRFFDKTFVNTIRRGFNFLIGKLL